ncbi:MAG: peptidase M23 [Rhizobiales bacterium PAR1]|nr:MAG: peptidase M23 [Rhizobiales bacterium PAR1]
MRKYGLNGGRVKLLASVMTAALLGACSSDVTRFGDDPFQSPFNSRAAFDPASTNSVNRQRTPSVPRQSLPPVTSSQISSVSTQALPAPSRPMMSTASAPLTTGSIGRPTVGSVGTSNYPSLSAVSSRQPSVLGSSTGWSAVGGTPVTLQQGENVNSLSSRYGVPVSAIMAVNGLSSTSQPQPGQQIMIPAYNAVQSGKTAATSSATSVIQRAPMQAVAAQPLPPVSPMASSPIPPRAVQAMPVAQPIKVAAGPARMVTPPIESDAEKRAAAKLKELKAGKPAPKANDDDEEEDDKPAAPKKKADDTKRLDEQKRADAAKKAAEMKAAEAKAKVEAEKIKAAKIAAAKKTKLKNDDEVTTSSISDSKPVARASQPMPGKPEPEKEATAPTPTPAAESDDSGSFRWPAKGRVISGFGARGTGGANDGINIALPEGTPVKAAEGGTVVHADDALKGYGKLVLIRHPNGFVSVYAHNGELKVKRGESVKRGQVIAASGQSGNVTAPQLHFEIRKGATPVDPMKQLSD